MGGVVSFKPNRVQTISESWIRKSDSTGNQSLYLFLVHT